MIDLRAQSLPASCRLRCSLCQTTPQAAPTAPRSAVLLHAPSGRPSISQLRLLDPPRPGSDPLRSFGVRTRCRRVAREVPAALHAAKGQAGLHVGAPAPDCPAAVSASQIHELARRAVLCRLCTGRPTLSAPSRRRAGWKPCHSNSVGDLSDVLARHTQLQRHCFLSTVEHQAVRVPGPQHPLDFSRPDLFVYPQPFSLAVLHSPRRS